MIGNQFFDRNACLVVSGRGDFVMEYGVKLPVKSYVSWEQKGDKSSITHLNRDRNESNLSAPAGSKGAMRTPSSRASKQAPT